MRLMSAAMQGCGELGDRQPFSPRSFIEPEGCGAKKVVSPRGFIITDHARRFEV